MSVIGDAFTLLRGDREADRTVPRSGQSARLSVLSSAAMAFLAVFALALSLTAGRVAESWSSALAQSATIRISAPASELEAQTASVLTILSQTPGIASARTISDEEQKALLAPWFGPDLPLEDLPVPRLIEIVETSQGFDATGLRQRLGAEAPGAVLDDHARWRQPLVEAAGALRLLGVASLVLIAGATGAMITLAAQASLAANEQVIRVMRLVGARDTYIARAFVRRFTLRALSGSAAGAALGVACVAALPASGASSLFLVDLGFSGVSWLWVFSVPVLAGAVAFFATRIAAFRTLRGMR